MRCLPSASLLTFSLLFATLAPTLRAQTTEAPAAPAQTTEVRTTILDDMPNLMLGVGPVGSPSIVPMLRPIAGAPFTATFSSESQRQLPDGSYIFTNLSGKLARDNQGSTYNEMTRTTGPSTNSRTRTVINVNNRVAGEHFTLDPENHIARRFGLASRQTPPGPGDAQSSAAANVTTDATSATTTTTTRTGRTAPPLPRAMSATPHPQIEKQDLGTDSMEGLIVNHYLDTQTIPAGEIGNERELIITNEVWYSRDLRINVKQIRKDPRSGQETLTLTEVERAEPPSSMFEIPADYTVTDATIGTRLLRSRSTQSGTTGVSPTEQPQP